MPLTEDLNGNEVQVFTPYENKNNITSLDVVADKVKAIALTEATDVRINGSGDLIRWPVAFYGIAPHVTSLTFGAPTDVIIMR